MKHFRFLILLLLILIWLVPANAQSTVTSAWGDTGLVVDYPDDWDADTTNESADLLLSDGNIYMYFYAPRRRVDSAREVLELLAEGAFDFGDIEESDIFEGEALRADFTNGDLTGFSLALEYDGQYLLVDSFVYDDRISRSEESDILDILETLRPESGSNNGDLFLEEAFGDADDAIAELEDLGLISSRGDFIIEEDMLTSAFDSTEILEAYDGGNLVMAALISWRAVADDEDYRICGFIAQSNIDDMQSDEGAAFVAGFDSDSAVVTFEIDFEDTDNSIFEAHEVDVDIHDPQHILMIIQDGEVMIFVNGELAVDAWALDLTDSDDELFAGQVVDVGCVMTGFWAYSFR